MPGGQCEDIDGLEDSGWEVGKSMNLEKKNRKIGGKMKKIRTEECEFSDSGSHL